jgi:acyl carrier protein
MDSIRERLIACFIAVFPELSREQAPDVSIENFAAWDSSHHFILMQVIEEDFGFQIPEEKTSEIDSFHAIEDLLTQELV